ncbi:hypothetical protein [Allosphingosinicella sp.]|uniref:hypothetical protein n=1 Tax=Allosphingosinicella sp. TaxID=2823234 RepID=UPI003783EF6E
MSALRRAWLGLVSVGVILFAFGSFTYALACEASCPAADHSGCGGNSNLDDCLVVCNTLCSAAVPAAPVPPGIGDMPTLRATALMQGLDGIHAGPDPPPPRM